MAEFCARPVCPTKALGALPFRSECCPDCPGQDYHHCNAQRSVLDPLGPVKQDLKAEESEQGEACSSLHTQALLEREVSVPTGRLRCPGGRRQGAPAWPLVLLQGSASHRHPPCPLGAPQSVAAELLETGGPVWDVVAFTLGSHKGPPPSMFSLQHQLLEKPTGRARCG